MSGRKVLLVEDEYFIAEDMARMFEARGILVVGPVASVDAALDIIDETDVLDGVVLDVNLQGEMAYPVADVLVTRGVPFVFATGYDEVSVPDRYAHVIRCEKPVDPDKILRALFT